MTLTPVARAARLTVALLASGSLVLAVGGCQSASTQSASGTSASGVGGSITVFAAASLTGTFTTLATQFQAAHPGTKVVTSFGSSATLATQIANGAPADVFASASMAPMKKLVDDLLVDNSTVFAHNTLEIAVAPGNPQQVKGLSDLPHAGKVVLCAVSVPCGAAAKQALDKAKVNLTPVSYEVDVKAAVQRVSSKEADASIVYVTDVKAAGASVAGVPIPASDNVTNDYPIGVVAASKNVTLASAFVAFVTSAEGQSVLTQAGFQGK